jgi:putative ABC transport system permease protein
MVHTYFASGRDPVGQRITVPAVKIKDTDILLPPTGSETFEIVGVAATARNRGLSEKPVPAIYIPYTVAIVPGCGYLIRTASDPHAFVRAIRERVRAVDTDQPVTEVLTLNELLHNFEQAYPRFSTTLFSIFAGVALALAAAGMYSLISYTVSRRTHEFGIRMALGAQGGDVARLVIAKMAKLIAVGLAVGLAASVALSSLIARYVQGWNPKDPVAFAGVALVLAAVALAACWAPARRATRIQPMIALRQD